MSDKDHSFTATLSIGDTPITFLKEAADRDVWVTSPAKDPSELELLNASQALGYLPGPDESWDHERDIGLVDFHVAEAPPALLYFRYNAGSYWLYARSGPQFGQGIFGTGYGLLEARPITNKDPDVWHMEDASTGQPFDISTAGDTPEVRLALGTSRTPVISMAIGVAGGYLVAAPGESAITLGLTIVERGVDWLSAK
jgi:hypothetical protein